MKPPRLPRWAPLSALPFLLLAACETGADRKALVEEARHSVPSLAATDTFFDGQVVAEVSVRGAGDMGVRRYQGPDGFKHDNTMKAGLGTTGVLGSGMGENNFGGTGDGNGVYYGSVGNNMDRATAQGAYEGDGGNGPQTGAQRGTVDGVYQGNKGMRGDYGNYDTPVDRRLRESQMPAAMLHLRLQNTTEATVVVQVRELNSSLGNFAVQPEEITLGPKESMEVEPMQSLLGVDTLDLPVTVSLRAGGQTEVKVITMHLVKPAPGTAPQPAPSAPTTANR